MHQVSRLWLVCLILGAALVEAAAADDWPRWRGPNFNGVAAEGQAPPTSWTDTKNVVWKTEVPGRGHSSPVIIGSQIFLTTADEAAQTQSVVSFDRKTGERLWMTEVNKGGFPAKIHSKNTHASPTVAYAGERLFAVFNNHDRAQLACLDMAGKLLWQKDAAPYVPNKYKFGFAPSPLIYKDTVIVSSEFDGEGSSLAAMRLTDGEEVWRTARPQKTSYSSPIVAHVAGRDQLLLSGCGHVTSYDPATGKELWQCEGPAAATCGTLVWDGDLVFASGGYPQKETLAVKADGSAEVVWRNGDKSYEQSMLAHDGFLYALNDTGIAMCWNAQTGKLQWRERLSGPVSASPILAGGNLYTCNEKGTFFVYKADPKNFQLVAKNQLGDESFATPTIVDSKIYLRVADSSGGKRRETLYCIGEN